MVCNWKSSTAAGVQLLLLLMLLLPRCLCCCGLSFFLELKYFHDNCTKYTVTRHCMHAQHASFACASPSFPFINVIIVSRWWFVDSSIVIHRTSAKKRPESSKQASRSSTHEIPSLILEHMSIIWIYTFHTRERDRIRKRSAYECERQRLNQLKRKFLACIEPGCTRKHQLNPKPTQQKLPANEPKESTSNGGGKSDQNIRIYSTYLSVEVGGKRQKTKNKRK